MKQDGMISEAEFVACVTKAGHTNAEQAACVFGEVDENADGKVVNPEP